MKHTGGSLPMYMQIAEMLVREVAAGRLIDGEKLAPERDMAADLGIAVGTLRKALAELQERGLLERVQGSGNYIRAVSDPQSVYAFFRLELIEGGGLPTAEVLDVARLAKPADLPAFGTSAEGHRIRRLRRIAGKPAAIEEIWLDGSYVDTIAIENMSESSTSITAPASTSGYRRRRIASISATCPNGRPRFSARKPAFRCRGFCASARRRMAPWPKFHGPGSTIPSHDTFHAYVEIAQISRDPHG